MTARFSDQQGYRPTAAQITVHEGSPPNLRGAILLIAEGRFPFEERPCPRVRAGPAPPPATPTPTPQKGSFLNP